MKSVYLLPLLLLVACSKPKHGGEGAFLIPGPGPEVSASEASAAPTSASEAAPQKAIECPSADGKYSSKGNIFDAVASDDLAQVRDLLKNGVDVNAREYDCATPLAKAKSLEMARLLIEEWHADVNALAKGSASVLSYQIYNRYPGLLADQEVYSAFLELMKYLLTQGANPNLVLESEVDRLTGGGPPLLQAAAAGDVELTKLLIEVGHADTNVRGYERTALNEVIQAWKISTKLRLNVMTVLLDHGANLEAKADVGRSPLYVALENNQLLIARWLLERGANVEDDSYWRSPLICATSHVRDLELYGEIARRAKHLNNRYYGNTVLDEVIGKADELSQAKAKILRELGACTRDEIWKKACATPDR